MILVFVRQGIIFKEHLNLWSHLGRDVLAGKGKNYANNAKGE